MARQATALRSSDPVHGSSTKRRAILEAAMRVFLADGYGAASMETIARAAGVAKQTIYAHFGTKAALFEATIVERCEWLLEPLPATAGDEDPAAALQAIARRFLDIILAPEAVARLRVIMAERHRFPELAELFYRSGPGRATEGLADYLDRLHRHRVLHVPDSRLAAGLFFGMIRGDVFLRHLLGLEPKPDADRLDRVVHAAVATFLTAHRAG
jgi:TetR/AcrR family transcriptional repressor of mexJK operon